MASCRKRTPGCRSNESLQWRAFRQTIHTLQRRGNRVFVLVGPFNSHLLTEANRVEWQQRREAIVSSGCRMRVSRTWLQNRCPAQTYADASHPLAVGYREIASQLLADSTFRNWLEPDAAPAD